jgi:hypothetical protein
MAGPVRFVTEDEDSICLGLTLGNTTKKQLHEARLSFLSGHSSVRFYSAIFIIIYLQARLSNFPPILSNTGFRLTYRVLKVLRPFVQFAIIILAFKTFKTLIAGGKEDGIF